MSSDNLDYQKLNKNQLVAICSDINTKYNELTTAYSKVYAEYVRLTEENAILKSKDSLNPEDEKIIDEINQELLTLKEKILESNLESDKLKEANKLLIEQIKELQEDKEMNHIKKLSDINSIMRVSPVIIKQNYIIEGFENRVDYSKTFGGKKFKYATVMVSLDLEAYTVNIEIVVENLNKIGLEQKGILNKKLSFKLSDKSINYLKDVAISKGWYNTLLDFFQVPLEHDPEAFFWSNDNTIWDFEIK